MVFSPRQTSDGQQKAKYQLERHEIFVSRCDQLDVTALLADARWRAGMNGAREVIRADGLLLLHGPSHGIKAVAVLSPELVNGTV
jgi:hypothetical protein